MIIVSIDRRELEDDPDKGLAMMFNSHLHQRSSLRLQGSSVNPTRPCS